MAETYVGSFKSKLVGLTTRWVGAIETFIAIGGYVWAAYLWSRGAPGWRVRSLITAATLLVGVILFMSGRAAWMTERKRRLDAEDKILSYANRLRTERWDTAIRSFESVTSREFKIVANFIEYSDGRTEWTWWGKPAENVRTCEIACRLAGEALSTLSSAKDLPEFVLSGPDAADRWLSFIVFKNDFDGPTGSGSDGTGVTHESRSIRDVPSASKRLCEDCRAEMLL